MAEIWDIENVYQNEDRRLSGFLLQSFFDHFLVSEFFNSHKP
jgi:acyl carrier protein phosphodiesterase